jgi:diguanylate cyclase (GGDEF)-like protein
MNEFEDYYKILQVHYLAEPEIIKEAYRRLSKMYHPDVSKSKDAEETMKQMNRAYEVLSDPEARKHYYKQWMLAYSGINNRNIKAEQQVHTAIVPIQRVLEQYLGFIAKQKFEAAYDLLSEKDKTNISRKEFIKWQTTVFEVFELKKFQCSFHDFYSDFYIQENLYDIVINFNVTIEEMNNVMESMEKHQFSKNVILENKQWRIILGHKELDSMMHKYDELIQLKKKKQSNKRKLQKQTNIDPLSGMLNRRGFLERAKNEQSRYSRYGNPFSIILCEIDHGDHWLEERIHVIEQVGELIKSSLRALDISCRWKSKKFLILLPETNYHSSNKVVNKIQFQLKQTIMQAFNPNYSLRYVVVEQEYSTLIELIRRAEELLKQLNNE